MDFLTGKKNEDDDDLLEELSQISQNNGGGADLESLVDSDGEGAEIFNDDDEDPLLANSSQTSSIHSESRIHPPISSVLGLPNTDHTASEDDDDEDDNHSGSGDDYTDDEDEGEDGYKPGGYHRVQPGEIYNQRYVGSFVI